MLTTDPILGAQSGVVPRPAIAESAVSWTAVFAGATAAAALSLILLMLGTGLGLSSISPWSSKGVSATAIGFSAIVWVTVTQILASGIGGYLAGRLRTKWTSTHVDEVHFRDTVHGFLTWAVATLLTAALLASVVGAALEGGLEAGATAVGGAASAMTAGAAAGASANSNIDVQQRGYFVDSLFRKDPTTPRAGGTTTESLADATSEVSRIIANALHTGELSPEDTHYVGQLVAQQTGVPQQDAEKRVTDTFNKAEATIKDAKQIAKEAADKARKASVEASLWIFISLLTGAFVASVAAVLGGRQRSL